MNTIPAVTVEWPTLAGSGLLASVLMLALVERLRRTFATQQDLNGLGDRVNALQNLYMQVREVADEVRDRTASITTEQNEQKYQWERIAEQVIRPLERITDKLESVSEAQAAQAAALEHVWKRLDADPPPPPRRR